MDLGILIILYIDLCEMQRCEALTKAKFGIPQRDRRAIDVNNTFLFCMFRLPGVRRC